MDHIAGTAVLDGVVVEVKYSSPETAIVAGSKQGVYRFYLNGNDREGHKRILNYMLDNGLVRRTKSSKLYNISIKYDSKKGRAIFLYVPFGDNGYREYLSAILVDLRK